MTSKQRYSDWPSALHAGSRFLKSIKAWHEQLFRTLGKSLRSKSSAYFQYECTINAIWRYSACTLIENPQVQVKVGSGKREISVSHNMEEITVKVDDRGTKRTRADIELEAQQSSARAAPERNPGLSREQRGNEAEAEEILDYLEDDEVEIEVKADKKKQKTHRGEIPEDQPIPVFGQPFEDVRGRNIAGEVIVVKDRAADVARIPEEYRSNIKREVCCPQRQLCIVKSSSSFALES